MPSINSAQSTDDEDSQSSSSARNETHTETPDDSEDHSQLENKIQELVDNLTAYFSRRRRKSTRGMMGIQRREYIVKGVKIHRRDLPYISLRVKEMIHSTTKKDFRTIRSTRS